MGQCTECGAWNSLIEETLIASKPEKNQRFANYAGEKANLPLKLDQIEINQLERASTEIGELDRVLGGGLVTGSVVLVGGDPGIGKSTLLLQTLINLSKNNSALYVSGEESLQQIAMRASRLSLKSDNLKLLAATQVEKIIEHAKQEKPEILVIDSIQTIYTDLLQSAPGGVGQVRESAAQLVRFAKQSGTALFIVGHVTKDGALAGPRVLEHMVDAVLYFEGETHSRYRIIRAIKNRFGAVNELGVFAMTDKGLKEIHNPSALFLSHLPEQSPGSVITSTWEGTRPLLVELQALVDESRLTNPRRVTLGLEQNRLSMLLAVLHRHTGIITYDQDVFINMVGGMKITETAADLPLLLAVSSSLRNKIIPRTTIAFGEVGLAGEIRPVANGQERLKEAVKHGFKTAIIPEANAPKQKISDLEIIPIKNITEISSI